MVTEVSRYVTAGDQAEAQVIGGREGRREGRKDGWLRETVLPSQFCGMVVREAESHRLPELTAHHLTLDDITGKTRGMSSTVLRDTVPLLLFGSPRALATLCHTLRRAHRPRVWYHTCSTNGAVSLAMLSFCFYGNGMHDKRSDKRIHEC